MANDFQNTIFGLLTLHGKEKVMAPVLWERLRVKIQHTQAYDTDSLGTFSGETERILAPIDCAKKKAELACSLTGYPIGLGSEGSFNPGPFGLLTFNEELVVCVNAEENWVVVGRSYQPSSVREQHCQNSEELAAFISQTPLSQGLILKAQEQLSKGLYGHAAIREQLYQWFGNSTQWPLTISFDLRAHHCPERRERIARATENLAERLLSGCPNCVRPGFWPDKVCIGLPCRLCGTPTNEIKQRIALCRHCEYQEVLEVKEEFADPFSCPQCNP
jgi:hypothetical protein